MKKKIIKKREQKREGDIRATKAVRWEHCQFPSLLFSFPSPDKLPDIRFSLTRKKLTLETDERSIFGDYEKGNILNNRKNRE